MIYQNLKKPIQNYYSPFTLIWVIMKKINPINLSALKISNRSWIITIFQISRFSKLPPFQIYDLIMKFIYFFCVGIHYFSQRLDLIRPWQDSNLPHFFATFVFQFCGCTVRFRAWFLFTGKGETKHPSCWKTISFIRKYKNSYLKRLKTDDFFIQKSIGGHYCFDHNRPLLLAEGSVASFDSEPLDITMFVPNLIF